MGGEGREGGEGGRKKEGEEGRRKRGRERGREEKGGWDEKGWELHGCQALLLPHLLLRATSIAPPSFSYTCLHPVVRNRAGMTQITELRRGDGGYESRIYITRSYQCLLCVCLWQPQLLSLMQPAAVCNLVTSPHLATGSSQVPRIAGTYICKWVVPLHAHQRLFSSLQAIVARIMIRSPVKGSDLVFIHSAGCRKADRR